MLLEAGNLAAPRKADAGAPPVVVVAHVTVKVGMGALKGAKVGLHATARDLPPVRAVDLQLIELII